MLRLTFRNVWAHKLRFLLTTFAVVMGVGFVVGSFIVTDSLKMSPKAASIVSVRM